MSPQEEAAETELLQRSAESAKIGPPLEVYRGPLRGIVGRLHRKDASGRLILAVDLVGQSVSVEVDEADVRALS